MSIQQVGVREFTKNFNKFQNMDFIEIIDKKTNSLKGIFLSAKEAVRIKKILENEKSKENKKKLNKIMKYAGKMEMDDKLLNLSKSELKKEISKLKAGIIDE